MEEVCQGTGEIRAVPNLFLAILEIFNSCNGYCSNALPAFLQRDSEPSLIRHGGAPPGVAACIAISSRGILRDKKERYHSGRGVGWEPPHPNIGNLSFPHASRSGFHLELSGGGVVSGTYPKLIMGGRIQPMGGGGRPATPPPPCRGGFWKIFSERWGGSLPTPPLHNN